MTGGIGWPESDHAHGPVTNTLVVGDNLAVLACLPAGCVDVVYLDPPYNTGSAHVYRDAVVGHAEWTATLRPRLEQARRVLAPSGALFCSIDDHEVAHLRLLLDEVMGERNFLAQIVVSLNPKGRQLGGGFALTHEYLLVYAADAAACVLDPTSPDAVDPRDFPLRLDGDPRPYRRLPLRNTNKRFTPATARTLHYPVWGHPDTAEVRTGPFPGAVEVWPVFGDGSPAVWRWSAPLVERRPADLECRRVRGRSGERVDVYQRDWLDPGRRKKLRTIWHSEEVGSTDTAVAELTALVGRVFDSPKPTGLLRRVLDTMPPDARVLDVYAGSGTTGHAVALANADDGGRRRCLSVNAPEPVRPGSAAEAAGHATVADVTRARLRAVADVVGGGFVELAADPGVTPRPAPPSA